MKVDNILVLAEGDQVLEEKISSTVIQKKRKATGQEDISLKSKQGRNLRVRVNQKKQEEVFIEHDVLDVMREAGNMTDKGRVILKRYLGTVRYEKAFKGPRRKVSPQLHSWLNSDQF